MTNTAWLSVWLPRVVPHCCLTVLGGVWHARIPGDKALGDSGCWGGRYRCKAHTKVDAFETSGSQRQPGRIDLLCCGCLVICHVTLTEHKEGIAPAAFFMLEQYAKRDNFYDDQDNATPPFPSTSGDEPPPPPWMQNQKTRLVCCQDDP